MAKLEEIKTENVFMVSKTPHLLAKGQEELG
jgi:hypothetical protein